ncbi:uncharacterized protein LOC120067609 [Benincasa hispida]|uniref:uncharacterized protein LOC120067609 n=1 Tax=Benincasa hispida TaxID=102211 RepID=UPI0018FF792E|nr:uncharacterized protein LOC120067609 [Benincasa hispida]
MDGQTEVTNRTLDNLLHFLSSDQLRKWNLAISQAKFAYNNMQSQSTGQCPFEVVYSSPPHLTFDLTNLPSFVDLSLEADLMIDRVQKIHAEVFANLTIANSKYKEVADKHHRPTTFFLGDLVMVYIKKSHLPTDHHSKFSQKKYDFFTFLQKFGDNAYQIELPSSKH